METIEPETKVVSIRQKMEDYNAVYLPLKEYVTEIQGSDICFITTELWKAYLTAMQKLPATPNSVTLNLPRQHIQLNIGCNFNYQVKRPRRTPQDMITLDKNRLIPEMLNDFENLQTPTQDFWIKRMKDLLEKHGYQIQTPYTPTPQKPKPRKKFLKKAWNRVQQLFTWRV